MKTKFLIIISVIIVFSLISFVMPNLSKVYGSCEMTQSGTLQFAIGYQWTNGLLYIDNAECTWKLFGVIPIASLLSEETSSQNFNIVQFAHASCAATILPQPCFDSFRISTEPLTPKSIMENFARNIEVDYPDWQMSDRNWGDFDEKLNLPAIICTEFVSDGMTHYWMTKWVDASKISSFENHRNDWMCNKWLPPVDDGITIKWDKSHYQPDDVGTVQATDKDMNLDEQKIDSFEMHVHSDIDHTGIQLTMIETAKNSGVFEGTVFFTTTEKSNDDLLLVEDAVHARHKENYNFARIINEPKSKVTGSYELKDEHGKPVCLGGRGMILNDQCQRIGNYDPQTGIPIVNNKEECDKLDGTWYDDRKLCDSKYAPVEYRFQFGPEHDVYDDSEEMRMASEKVFFAEESMGFGSGTSIVNGSDFQLGTIIVGIVVGLGSFAGLMIFWRNRK